MNNNINCQLQRDYPATLARTLLMDKRRKVRIIIIILYFIIIIVMKFEDAFYLKDVLGTRTNVKG